MISTLRCGDLAQSTFITTHSASDISGSFSHITFLVSNYDGGFKQAQNAVIFGLLYRRLETCGMFQVQPRCRFAGPAQCGE